MGIWEILLIVGCATIVFGVIIGSIVRKKQGKHSCGFYCDGNCGHCIKAKDEKKPE
ncbi:MAG: hypothetical protein J5697_00160 [Clostridia bacterium]|nr:hypothetical protein [Clostridia bacterium]